MFVSLWPPPPSSFLLLSPSLTPLFALCSLAILSHFSVSASPLPSLSPLFLLWPSAAFLPVGLSGETSDAGGRSPPWLRGAARSVQLLGCPVG